MAVFLGLLFGVLLAASIALAVISFIKANKPGAKVNKERGKAKNLTGLTGAGLAVVFLILLIFIPGGFKTVNTGELAVVKVFGEAKEVKTAGLHFRNIVTTQYIIYDLKTQQMNIENEVYTKDAQPLRIELTIQYSIMADKAIEINRAYGTMDILAQRIEKIAIEKAKVVLSADTAMGLIETRASLSPKLFAEVKTIGTQYYVNVENVVIVDMAFSEAFEKAVEDKMVAQQEVIKAEAEKEKAIIKAEQDLEVAKLNAEQALAKAQGEADAKIAIAKAEARALKLKSIEAARMLGFTINEITNNENEIIDYEIDMTGKTESEVKLISEYLKYIAYLEAWDGKLPQVVGDNFDILIPINP